MKYGERYQPLSFIVEFFFLINGRFFDRNFFFFLLPTSVSLLIAIFALLFATSFASFLSWMMSMQSRRARNKLTRWTLRLIFTRVPPWVSFYWVIYQNSAVENVRRGGGKATISCPSNSRIPVKWILPIFRQTVDKKNKKERKENILRILNNLLRAPRWFLLNIIIPSWIYNPSTRIIKVEEFDFIEKKIFQSRRKIRRKKRILLAE